MKGLGEVVKLKDLDYNFEEIFQTIIDGNGHVIIGYAENDEKTATLISTKILRDLLGSYKFDTKVFFDEETNQYESSVSVIDAYGCGDTKGEAIDMLLDNIIDLAQDFYNNLDIYLQTDNTKQQYPYYLRIFLSITNKDDLSKLLDLK